MNEQCTCDFCRERRQRLMHEEHATSKGYDWRIYVVLVAVAVAYLLLLDMAL